MASRDQRRDDGVTPGLAPFELEELEHDPASICALDSDLRIAYVNPSWRRFGRANGLEWGTGGWTTGVPILDAVPATLRPFHEDLFSRALGAAKPVEHSYDCSSPTVFRRFRMLVFRCDAGASSSRIR